MPCFGNLLFFMSDIFPDNTLYLITLDCISNFSGYSNSNTVITAGIVQYCRDKISCIYLVSLPGKGYKQGPFQKPPRLRKRILCCVIHRLQSQAFSSLCPSGIDNPSAARSGHSFKESVFSCSFPITGLICPFHYAIILISLNCLNAHDHKKTM